MSEPRPARVEPGLFRAAVDVSPEAVAVAVAVAVFDREWRVVHVNPAGGRLLGRTPADLLDRVVWTAVPEGTGTDGRPPVSAERFPDADSDRLRVLAEVSEADDRHAGHGEDRGHARPARGLPDARLGAGQGPRGRRRTRQPGRAHRDPSLLADVDSYLNHRAREARDEPPLRPGHHRLTGWSAGR